MKVLILGGAGLVAEAIERDLLEIDGNEVSKITVADINQESIKKRIEELNSPKVFPKLLDIDNHGALVESIREHDVVVNAAAAITTLAAVKAALQARVNIIGVLGIDLPACGRGAPLNEIGLPTQEFKDQVDQDFKEAGVTAIMGLGSMPGVSNLMARYFADKLDTVESIEFSYALASLAKTKTFFAFNPLDMISLFKAQPVILRDGKLIRIPRLSGQDAITFPEPIGKREVFYTFHDEPVIFSKSFKDKGLKNAGTKTGWTSEFLGKVQFLDSLGLLDFRPRKIRDVSIAPVRVLEAGLTLEKVTPQDYGCTHMILIGEKSGQRLEYTAEMVNRPYKGLSGTQYRTGIPAAIGVRMLIKGQIQRKGAFPPEIGIDPKVFFKELARRELHVSYTVKYLVA